MNRRRLIAAVRICDGIGEGVVGLDETSASCLGLRDGIISLAAGSHISSVRVRTGPGSTARIVSMSSALAARLGLVNRQSVGLYNRRGSLRVGPYVGILTGQPRGGANGRVRFGDDTEFYRKLHQAGSRLGIVPFALPFTSIRTGACCVKGYIPEPGQGDWWAQRDFPFPDVVYNRIPGRRAERVATSRGVLTRLIGENHARLFNEGFMDKWSMYCLLSSLPTVKSMLPDTALLRGSALLQEWLEKHESVYLKPVNGSAGRGIVVIDKVAGGYSYRFRNAHGEPVVRRASDFGRLWQRVRGLTRGRRYLLQPNLRLLQRDGAPFDVRLLMQRDSAGKWQRTKMYARVASSGEYASNISRGGTGTSLDGILRDALPTEIARSLVDQVRRAGRLIAQAVSEASESDVGELGIDMGIDERGKLWLIEVNSKPHVEVLNVRDWDSTKEASVRRPMEFALYLAMHPRDDDSSNEARLNDGGGRR